MINFDITAFRAMFPPYADTVTYPDTVLQLYWDNATAYMSADTAPCSYFSLKLAQQTLGLNLMTAHLAYLNTIANSGQNTGLMQGATIDKITVQLTPPPVPNQWQWWLDQSPYGQQLLALLQAAAVGGAFYGGYPTNYTLRR